MVHKRTTELEARIVLALCKQPNHLRGIATDMSIPHSTILRSAQRLLSRGVIDAARQGKNRIFSLKRGLPARYALYQAEAAKAGWLLSAYPELVPILEDVLAAARTNLVILFGSYARFAAKPESDIDLFLETKNRSVKEAVKNVHSKLSPKIGAFAPETLLGREIVRNHVILRGIEEFYERVPVFA